MRKLIVAAVLALTVVLALTPLAIAKSGKHAGHAKGKVKFALVGTAAVLGAVEPGAGAGEEPAVTDEAKPADGVLIVNVKAGTKTVRAFRGKELPISIAENAKIRLVTAEGCVAAELGDIADGAKVKVRGRIVKNDGVTTFEATFVKAKNPVSAPSVPVEPVTPEPMTAK